MPSIIDILAGSVGGEEQYYGEDPFYMGGRALGQIQMPQAQSNAQAFLFPFLQNALAGTLTGYGKRRGNEAAWTDAKASPFIASMLESEKKSIGQEGYKPNSFLAPYLADEMPEGFTVKDAKAAQMMGLLNWQNELEAKQEYQKLINKATVESSQPMLEAIKKKAAAEVEGKTTGESKALGYNPKLEEETDKLRKEFSALPEVKNFSLVEKAGKIINKAIEDPSAVSDQELVRYSIQLIEPGMAVREGEQKAVASSQAIPAEWKGALNKSLNGGTALGDEVREGLKHLAERAYQGNKEQYDRTFSFYQSEAERKGLDKGRISYIGDAQPSLITKTVNGTEYVKVPGGWRPK